MTYRMSRHCVFVLRYIILRKVTRWFFLVDGRRKIPSFLATSFSLQSPQLQMNARAIIALKFFHRRRLPLRLYAEHHTQCMEWRGRYFDPVYSLIKTLKNVSSAGGLMSEVQTRCVERGCVKMCTMLWLRIRSRVDGSVVWKCCKCERVAVNSKKWYSALLIVGQNHS